VVTHTFKHGIFYPFFKKRQQLPRKKEKEKKVYIIVLILKSNRGEVFLTHKQIALINPKIVVHQIIQCKTVILKKMLSSFTIILHATFVNPHAQLTFNSDIPHTANERAQRQ
jgi:hypothetical protein